LQGRGYERYDLGSTFRGTLGLEGAWYDAKLVIDVNPELIRRSREEMLFTDQKKRSR